MRALVFGEAGLALDREHPMPAPPEGERSEAGPQRAGSPIGGMTPPPSRSKAGEALIRVLLAGVCNTDIEIVRGYLGFHGVPGHEFVGVVEAIAGETAQEQYGHLVGRRVVGEINAACHRADCPSCARGMPTHCPTRTTLGILGRDGAFAEYLTLPAENLHLVPDEVSDEAAVFVEPLAANFEMLEQVHLHPTDRVIILGDGKMGQLAAQVLALVGCDVTMVGRHAEKLALAETRGVRTHLASDAGVFALDAAERVDMVVECTGSAGGLEMALRLVRPRGTIMLKSTVADRSTIDLAPIVIDEIRVQGSRCGPFEPALRALSQQRVEVRQLVSARYPLEEGVAAFAHAQRRGALKVLVRI